jgi:hypothetical protein
VITGAVTSRRPSSIARVLARRLRPGRLVGELDQLAAYLGEVRSERSLELGEAERELSRLGDVAPRRRVGHRLADREIGIDLAVKELERALGAGEA